LTTKLDCVKQANWEEFRKAILKLDRVKTKNNIK